MVNREVKTPCIGVCSTGIGDNVCRGCKRFTHEIIHWNSFADQERKAIWLRLDVLLSQVVKAKVIVENAEILIDKMRKQQIPFDSNRDPYCLLFDLLKAGASQIDDLSEYGCRLTSEFSGASLVKLRSIIDQDFYVLSDVHYERYFLMHE